MTKKAPAKREAKTPAQQLAQSLDMQREQFAQSLPPDVSLDKFMRTTLTAIQNTPALLKADRRTLFHACARAAQDGLLPDGRQGAIVCYGDVATWMPMVEGRILQAARNGITIDSFPVYQYEVDNGLFKAQLGDNPRIEHEPAPFGVDRGELVGVYAIAKLPDGSRIRELMHRDEIEKVRLHSKNPNKGPWKDWLERMARKTVINRLAKSLPDEDLRASIAAEEQELFGGDPPATSATVISSGPQPKGPRPKALQHIIDQEAEEVDDTPPADDEPPAEEGEL